MNKEELIEVIEREVDGWLTSDCLAHPTEVMAENVLNIIEQAGFHLVRKDAVEIIEGEPKEGDICRFVFANSTDEVIGRFCEGWLFSDSENSYCLGLDEGKVYIIQRNNKPALKKEIML